MINTNGMNFQISSLLRSLVVLVGGCICYILIEIETIIDPYVHSYSRRCISTFGLCIVSDIYKWHTIVLLEVLLCS